MVLFFSDSPGGRLPAFAAAHPREPVIQYPALEEFMDPSDHRFAQEAVPGFKLFIYMHLFPIRQHAESVEKTQAGFEFIPLIRIGLDRDRFKACSRSALTG